MNFIEIKIFYCIKFTNFLSIKLVINNLAKKQRKSSTSRGRKTIFRTL